MVDWRGAINLNFSGMVCIRLYRERERARDRERQGQVVSTLPAINIINPPKWRRLCIIISTCAADVTGFECAYENLGPRQVS